MLVLSGLQALIAWAVAGVVFVFACRPMPSGRAPVDDSRQLSLLVLGVGTGLGLVPATAFFFYTATNIVVSWATTLLSAAVWCAAGVVIWRVRTRRSGKAKSIASVVPCGVVATMRDHRLGLTLAAFVSVIYAVKFDRSVASIVATCVNEVAFMALDVLPDGAGVMRRNISDARLGNPAVIASFLAQFHGLGQRALMASCGGLIGLGGYALGCVLTKQRRYGYFAAAVLALNPWVLKFPLPDENLYTLAFASCWLPALLVKRTAWWPIGLLAGLTIGMREPLWLAVPAMLLAARRDGLRAYFLLLGAIALSTLPYHIHHHLALGSVLTYEGMGQVPTFMHSLGPFELPWQGMMNWPLHSEVVRTPHNPWPMFVLWPLWLLDHFGLALVAVGLVGIVAAWRRDRVVALVLAGLFVPAYVILAVQENWDDPNKMGVLLILFGPLVAAMVLGAQACVRRPRRELVAAIAVAVALGLSVQAIADWRARPDPRYRSAFGEDATEQPTLLERDAQHLASIAPWPDFGRVDDFYDFASMARFRDLVDHISKPRLAFRSAPWGWFEHRIVDHGGPVVLELDLRTPPWTNSAPFRVVGGGKNAPDIDVDLIASSGIQLVSPVSVPWSKRPLTIALTPSGEKVTGAMIAFGTYDHVRERKDAMSRRGVERYRDVQFDLHWLLIGEGRGGDAWRPRPAVPASPVVWLKVPSGSFSVAFTVSARAVRTLVWRGVIRADKLDVSGPWYAIHN